MISGNLIREARLRAGMTQAELASRAGTAASAVSRWERDQAAPSLETVRALVRATGNELSLGIAPADDHDLALIRRCLSREPAARLAGLVEVVRTLRSMADARA